jgi:hypothetical protein
MTYNIYTYVGDVNKFRQTFQAPFSAFETMHEEYIKYSNMGAVLISSKRTQMGFEYEMLLDDVVVKINLYIND